MWATGAAGFFAGFDRLNPRSWGRKGCLFALLILVLAALLLAALARWLGIGGVALFAVIVLVVTWVPISRMAKANRMRSDSIAREIRSSAVTDSDFRLGESQADGAAGDMPAGPPETRNR